ncbi:methyltransferase domain-containing protein [Thermobifida halotolerans]|uniref:Methyltransferase domain-containing protein n=1 Tax=Thermobifida halotolerans TaxID=483545 RepID=A0A399G5X6_9ACTN|nr:class I SAM-dependent methyltransferase [Thermobifida halotolerans]UOE20898.1 methyltransferase domain-containing protein [Thermobifida halotolerans]
MTSQTWNAELYDSRHSFVAEYGTALLDLLDASPGERVLDAGCGTGDHVAELVRAGVCAVGVDASPEMVERAAARFPEIEVSVADLRDLSFREEFDAVLSNAVLHWVPEADRAAASLHAALRPGGRLVAELGGAGNISAIDSAVRALRAERGLPGPVSPWYFPTVAEYARVLESAGFEVRAAWLFDRPTRLTGPDGLADWVRMFAAHLLADVAAPDAFLAEVAERLRPTLYRDGSWWADYRRLRVVAVR